MVIPAPWFWNQLHTSCWHLAWYGWLGDQCWKQRWSHWYCCHGFQKTPLDTLKCFSYAIGSGCKRCWQINFEEKNGVSEHQSKGSVASRHLNKKIRKCLVAHLGPKASTPDPMSNPCREAAFSVTLDTCSAAWGCDNARGRSDTLFWPQFQTHSLRIFVPTRRGNSEFMYAKVNGIAHFTWPRQLWMEQKLFVPQTLIFWI